MDILYSLPSNFAQKYILKIYISFSFSSDLSDFVIAFLDCKSLSTFDPFHEFSALKEYRENFIQRK